MVDLRSLEVFFWVVKLGGFGRAAGRLRITQPGISQRISQIEARHNVKLLDRSSHKAVVLTAKGMEVYSYAERLLALHSEMMGCLSTPVALSGTVRIGVSETLVHTMLGDLVGCLHARHPLVTPEIVVDTSPNLQASLLSGKLDVALLLGPVNEPGARNVPMRDYELAWVAKPDLPLSDPVSGTGTLTLADLARWPILSYARGTQPHAAIADLFRRPDLPPSRIFASTSVASILRMALDGIGVGILPLAVVAGDIAAGRLAQLKVERTLAPLRYTASYLAMPGSGVAQSVAEMAARLSRQDPIPEDLPS